MYISFKREKSPNGYCLLHSEIASFWYECGAVIGRGERFESGGDSGNRWMNFLSLRICMVYIATVQPQKWRFRSIFNFHVIAEGALIASATYVFDHGDHFFMVEKSRKKSEMAKSDKKLVFRF